MSGKKKLIKSVLTGTLCAVMVQIVLLCLVSIVMITTKKLFGDVLSYIMLGTTALGALAGGFISAKLNNGAGLVAGLLTGFAVFLIITTGGLINSSSPLSVLSLIRLAAALLGGAAGGIFGVRESHRIRV